jgi:hypothetical protein
MEKLESPQALRINRIKINLKTLYYPAHAFVTRRARQNTAANCCRNLKTSAFLVLIAKKLLSRKPFVS